MTVSPIDDGGNTFNNANYQDRDSELAQQLSREIGGMTLREVMAKVESTADSFQYEQQMGYIAGLVLFLSNEAEEPKNIPVANTLLIEEEVHVPPLLSFVEDTAPEKEVVVGFDARQTKYLNRLFGEASADLEVKDARTIAEVIVSLRFGDEYAGRAKLELHREAVTLYLQGVVDEEISNIQHVSAGGLSVSRTNFAKKIEKEHSEGSRQKKLLGHLGRLAVEAKTQQTPKPNEATPVQEVEEVQDEPLRIIPDAVEEEESVADTIEVEEYNEDTFLDEAIYGDDNKKWKEQAEGVFERLSLSGVLDAARSEALARHMLNDGIKSKPAIQAIEKLGKVHNDVRLGMLAETIRLDVLASSLFSAQKPSAPMITGLVNRLNQNNDLNHLTENQAACLAVGIIDKLCIRAIKSR